MEREGEVRRDEEVGFDEEVRLDRAQDYYPGCVHTTNRMPSAVPPTPPRPYVPAPGSPAPGDRDDYYPGRERRSTQTPLGASAPGASTRRPTTIPRMSRPPPNLQSQGWHTKIGGANLQVQVVEIEVASFKVVTVGTIPHHLKVEGI